MPLVITYTFSPGAIIFASRFNTNFSDVKNWADAHEIDASGVHGVTGNIVGTSDVQSLSNKTLVLPEITGDGAGTATLEYENSANNRTLTIPDPGADDTFVTLTATQNLTNKTLTNATITGGTLNLNAFGLSNSSTQTSVVAASNAAAITIQNTDTTVNNYQSLDFKNDTGAIVGRIANVNADHTAASEDTNFSAVLMNSGTLTERLSIVGSTGLSTFTLSSGGFIHATKGSGGGGATNADTLVKIENNGACYLEFETPNTNQAGIIFSDDGAAAGQFIYDHNTNRFSFNQVVNISSTNRLYFGSGVTSSIRESASNVLTFELGSNDRLALDNSSVTNSFMTFSNTAQTTGHIINIPNADSLTTGSVINIVSNSSSTSTRSLINIHNDNSSATSTACLTITQDAADNCITMTNNSSGSGARGISVTMGASGSFSARGINIDNNGAGHSLYVSDASGGAEAVYFSHIASSGADMAVLSLRGSNSGAGNFIGLDVNDSSFDFILSVPNDTGAVGAHYGRIPIRMNGLLKYIDVRN